MGRFEVSGENCTVHARTPRHPLLSPARSWRLLCIAQAGPKSDLLARKRERKKRKGRKSTRSKKRDTVMTQTSCILVPHKARQLWERACVVTHARVLTSGIDDHARHGLFITDSGPLLSFSPLLLRGEEGRERHLEICCPKLPLLEFSRFGE